MRLVGPARSHYRRKRAWSFTKLLAEGDSITAGSYPDTWATANLTIRVTNAAIAGAGLGTLANLDDGTNTLYGRRGSDLVGVPDVMTVMIGANNLRTWSGGGSAYCAAVLDWAAPFVAAGTKVIIAEPTPYGSAHTDYINYNTHRDEFITALRASLGSGFHAILPFGRHHLLGDVAYWGTNFSPSDGVHSNALGYTFIQPVYDAVLASLKTGNLTSTQCSAFSFGNDISGAALSQANERYFVVTGLGLGMSATFTLSGTNPSHTIKRGNGTAGTSAVTASNGDTIVVSAPASASNSAALTTIVTSGTQSTTLTVTTVAASGPAPDLIARMTAAGSTPDSTRQGYITTLVNALVSAGVWDKMDVLYVFAAHSKAAALLNWKEAGYTATEVSAPTFVVDRGFTGNGTSSYLDSGFNPFTASTPKFTRNSGHLGTWSRSNVTGNTSSIGFSAGFGGQIQERSGTGTGVRGRINSGTVAVSAVTADSLGHHSISRTTSTLTTFYKGGASVGTDATASAAIATGVLQVLAGMATFSTRQIAAAHCGSGLNDTETLAVNNALQAYMTAVGA